MKDGVKKNNTHKHSPEPSSQIADTQKDTSPQQNNYTSLQAGIGNQAVAQLIQSQKIRSEQTDHQSLPDNLRTGLEILSGLDMSGTRVYRNSSKPAQFSANAFAQGQKIYLGPGQDKHLSHEAWHVVQQLQGRVKETNNFRGNSLNNEPNLEREADIMGAKASRLSAARSQNLSLAPTKQISPNAAPIQLNARESEIDFLVTQIFDVLSNVRELGATTEFVLWVNDGAITMVSHRQTNQGTVRQRALNRRAMERALSPSSLQTFIGLSNGYVTLSIEREANSWSLNSFRNGAVAGQPPTPPEGRSIPIDVTDYSADARAGIQRLERELFPLLNVSIDGQAEMRVSVVFDDDRLVSWSPDRYTNSGPHNDGNTANVNTSSRNRILGAVLPFTQGLGTRTIDLVIRGRHSGRATTSTWDVTSAGARRAAQSRPDEAQAIVDEYRNTHAQIIADWREGVEDAAIMAASFTLEQVALWVIGGWIFRVFGAGIRLVAPRLVGILRSAAGRAGAEYLETLIVRLASTEKAALRRLMAKAETEGLSALTAAERRQLVLIFERLEAMVVAPITTAEKARLRSAMVGRFTTAHPTVSAAFNSAGRSFQIHHRTPLEWGHLMRGFDVNAGTNLIALETTVHRGVNAVWTRFRTAPASRVTPQHVRRVAEIIDTHFARWYNTPPNAAGLASEVTAAKNAARAEVDVIVAALRSAP